jgi:hypothetical protein
VTVDGSGIVIELKNLAVKERSARDKILEPVNWNATPEPPKEVTAQCPLKIFWVQLEWGEKSARQEMSGITR